MSRGCFVSLAVLVLAISVMSFSTVPVAGQASSPKKATSTTVAKTWVTPRTPDGQPDLRGVWANNNVTPLERPKELAGRQFLSDAEVASLKERAEELFGSDSGDAAFGDSVFVAALSKAKTFTSTDVGTGNYNHFWLVERDFDNRTALIADPPDGRLPALTPEAEKRRAEGAAARRRRAEGPEDRSLSERCISFGVPRLGAGYNSYYEFVQTRDYVVIHMETIHDARVIPLDGRPHLPSNLHLLHGDSRGHWEGDTLVVETTNFSSKSNVQGASENVRIIERFTRVGLTTINYEITASDPATWTKPWTAMIPLKGTSDLIYEYACHEGNSGLAGILAGARAEEKFADEDTTRK